jgi:capsular polysaccharide biosynthesis protein
LSSDENTSVGATPSAGGHSARTLFETLLRRAWVIGLLIGLSALWTWYFVHDNQTIYEQTSSFLLGPRSDLSEEQSLYAIQAANQNDIQLVRTVAGVLGSDRFLSEAAQDAGISALPAGYDLSATVQPGADIINFSLRGPDPAVLTRITSALEEIAPQWVSNAYDVYDLEFLQSQASDGPVAPQTGKSVILAAFLGGLVAVGLVVVEHKARTSRLLVGADGVPSGVMAQLSVHPEAEDGDGNERIDRLESALRTHLDPGESLVRVGRGRLQIIRREPSRRRTRSTRQT